MLLGLKLADCYSEISKLEFQLNEIRTSPLYLLMLKIRRSLLFRFLDKHGLIKRKILF